MSIDISGGLLREIAFETSQTQYYPNADVERDLGGIIVVPIVGPRAIGKTSCMEQIEDMDGGFTIATSFTTRPQNPNERPDAYDFIPHDPVHLEDIAQRVHARDFVQCTVHANGYVYGTEAEAFEPPFALFAPLATEVEKLEALPFEDVIPISLAAPIDDYARRFVHEAGLRHKTESQVQTDLDEAEASLTWSLDRGRDAIWVANPDGRLVSTAAEVIRIARGAQEPNIYARRLGEQMLRGIRDLRQLF